MSILEDVQERFWTKVEERLWSYVEEQDNGCCLWVGYVANNGYGHISVAGHPYLVHRLAHELWVGPIPEDYQVDHLCRVPLCVQPLHLEAVTQYENLMRSNAWSAVNARKKFCPRHHPLTRGNLRPDTRGRRSCLVCFREQDARRHREARKRSHAQNTPNLLQHH